MDCGAASLAMVFLVTTEDTLGLSTRASQDDHDGTTALGLVKVAEVRLGLRRGLIRRYDAL